MGVIGGGRILSCVFRNGGTYVAGKDCSCVCVFPWGGTFIIRLDSLYHPS